MVDVLADRLRVSSERAHASDRITESAGRPCLSAALSAAAIVV